MNIPIVNPSFETNEVFTAGDSQCGGHRGTVAGWTFGAGSVAYQPAGNTCGIPAPPDGETVALSGYGSNFWQTLSTTYADLQRLPSGPINGIYELKFWVGSYFESYPGYYTVEISFGTQELCEASGWGAGGFKEITIVCPGPGGLCTASSPGGGPTQADNGITITFSVDSWPLLFDSVSLDFTPQP